jgi:large-conductance mechanosensitive channel
MLEDFKKFATRGNALDLAIRVNEIAATKAAEPEKPPPREAILLEEIRDLLAKKA